MILSLLASIDPVSWIIIALFGTLFLTGCATMPADVKRPPFMAEVAGNSMLPTLTPGIRYFVPESSYEAIKVGTIVVMWHPVANGLIVHRVVRGEPGRWVTKGDNNANEDYWYCTPEYFIGIPIFPETMNATVTTN